MDWFRLAGRVFAVVVVVLGLLIAVPSVGSLVENTRAESSAASPSWQIEGSQTWIGPSAGETGFCLEATVALDNARIVSFSGVAGSADAFILVDSDGDVGGNVSVGSSPVSLTPLWQNPNQNYYVLIATNEAENQLVVSCSLSELTGADFDATFPEFNLYGGHAGLIADLRDGRMHQDLEMLLDNAGDPDGLLLTPFASSATLYAFPSGQPVGSISASAFGDPAPPPCQPVVPAAPSNLEARQIPEQIHLTWQDNSDDESGFRIEYKVFPGIYPVLWRHLATVGPNRTSYQMDGASMGSTYHFRVAGISDQGTSLYSDTAVLTIRLTIFTISIQSPNGGEIWPVGSSQRIGWATGGRLGPSRVTIRASADGGSTWKAPPIVADIANTGSYTWTVPGPLSNNYVLKVEDAQDGFPYDLSNHPFIIGLFPILPTSTPSATRAATRFPTATRTATATPTSSATRTATWSPSSTCTLTATGTPTETPTGRPTATLARSPTATATLRPLSLPLILR